MGRPPLQTNNFFPLLPGLDGVSCGHHASFEPVKHRANTSTIMQEKIFLHMHLQCTSLVQMVWVLNIAGGQGREAKTIIKTDKFKWFFLMINAHFISTVMLVSNSDSAVHDSDHTSRFSQET